MNENVPAELEAICERAMARDKQDRYDDVSELADDLRAFVEGRVMRAYETGAWAEARKWVKRNRALAAALMAAVLLLVAGLLTSLALKSYADEQRGIAEGNEKAALRSEEEAHRLKGVAEANAAGITTAVEEPMTV